MGMSLFKTCSTNYTPGAPAPNPDPLRYQVLRVWNFANAYVLKVHYFDCTNFEGIKIMVYRGGFRMPYGKLDPHFAETPESPIARFAPTLEGIELAKEFARKL